MSKQTVPVDFDRREFLKMAATTGVVAASVISDGKPSVLASPENTNWSNPRVANSRRSAAVTSFACRKRRPRPSTATFTHPDVRLLNASRTRQPSGRAVRWMSLKWANRTVIARNAECGTGNAEYNPPV